MNSTHGGAAGEDGRLPRYPSPTTDSNETLPYFHDQQGNPQESATSDHPVNQHQSSHAASVEELQLAAQLGQDLATEPMVPVSDSNMKFDESNLRNIMPHAGESGLRASLAHAEDAQGRSFGHGESTSASSAAAQVPASINQHLSSAYSNGNDDSTPPRKRSKISRACDECRRKKIKCDAQSDSGDLPCSNCRRASQRCSFSRIPQKRGPSKGYIKELADRINNIEGRLGETPGEESNRKRAFSAISGAADLPAAHPRQTTTAWNTDARLRAVTPERGTASYAPESLAPQPMQFKPDTPSRPPVATMEGGIGDVHDMMQAREIDDDVYEGYLSMIHPYLPILPSSRPRLQVFLAQCSGFLREAFLEALGGAIHSFPSFTGLATGDVGLAMKMLVEWETNDDAPHSPASSFIHLQTLILLLIESESRPGGCPAPLKESLMGRAVGAAWAMKLYNSRPDKSLSNDGDADVDSETNLRVRLWWSLVVLDRFNAVATGTPTMIRKDAVIAVPKIENAVGETASLLIRLSKVLGQASTIISSYQAPVGTTSTADAVIGGVLHDYVENFREDLPSHVDPTGYPIVHMAYWHSRLLSYLLDPSAKATSVMWASRGLVRLLTSTHQAPSPWHHHFVALAMLALVEMSRGGETKEEASRLLAEMRALHSVQADLEGLVSERVTLHHRQSNGTQGPLQRLADVAASSTPATKVEINEEGSGGCTTTGYGEMGFDPRSLLAAGYIKLIRTNHPQA